MAVHACPWFAHDHETLSNGTNVNIVNVHMHACTCTHAYEYAYTYEYVYVYQCIRMYAAATPILHSTP